MEVTVVIFLIKKQSLTPYNILNERFKIYNQAI